MKGFITCTYWHGARSVLGKDWHDENVRMTRYNKFYYVEKGEIVVQIYDRTITLGPGDLMLIPIQTVHSFWMTEEAYAEKSWCHFSLRSISGEFFEKVVLDPVLKVPDREYVKNLFDQIFSSHDMPAPQKDLVATNAICALVQYFLEHSQVSMCDTDNRIKKVIDYIEQHYAEKISMEQLAEVACYSPKHLSRCCRETTGLPPIRYLNLVRIERARYLLQYSDESIGQIMGKCGFTDAAYFSRVFKKTMGYSPQTFREMCNTQRTEKK